MSTFTPRIDEKSFQKESFTEEAILKRRARNGEKPPVQGAEGNSPMMEEVLARRNFAAQTQR